MDALTIAAFGVGVAGVGISAVVWVRLKRETAELRVSLQKLEADAREMERDLTKKFEARANLSNTPAAGAPALARFRENTTIGEVLLANANAKEILARFHIGGCSSCSASESETLGAAARGHAVDLHALLSALNAPIGSVCESKSSEKISQTLEM